MLRFLSGLLILFSAIFSGCAANNTAENKNTCIVVYSEVDADFTESLAAAYSKAAGVQVKTIYDFKDESNKADIILAEHEKLIAEQENNKLQKFICSAGDRLPLEFKDQNDFWYGAFYDPVVFLVNQQFARDFGQENIKTWDDLEDYEIRIAIENLSNTVSTQNFLSALASNKGETIALNYLYNINKNISQYAKFPFTSIRMTAVGDADIAITRRSYVFKYLENDFPAYIVFPHDGTTVNLYGAGIYADTKNADEAIKFADWLISSDIVKKLAQEKNTGFLFLLPQGIDGQAVNPERIWINTKYLTNENKTLLVNKWLETVRFSNNR